MDSNFSRIHGEFNVLTNLSFVSESQYFPQLFSNNITNAHDIFTECILDATAKAFDVTKPYTAEVNKIEMATGTEC